MAIQKYVEMLGLKAEDQITGYKGTIVSVAFDLYGCIQCALNPGLDKEGKIQVATWFDANRLKITDSTPSIKQPSFDYYKAPVEETHGPEDKPTFDKP